MSRFFTQSTYALAAAIAAVAFIWIASGAFFGSSDTEAVKTPTELAAEATSDATSVRVRTIRAEMRSAELVLRGKTRAFRKVEVRSETTGVVAALPAEKGQTVTAGDTVCELKVEARQAMLDQARAGMRKAQLEYEAARRLSGKGYRSETDAAAALAAFEASQAEVRQREEELENTKITAPFDGFVDNRFVEVGDYMNVGQVCAMVVDTDPFLIVGQASERDVASIKPGDRGRGLLITGETIEGKIRFVSKVADAATRTFLVELEVPNTQGTLRDGVTAEIRIPVQQVAAHRLSPAVLSLNDTGTLGVRVVESGRVKFLPVAIIDDESETVWVSGLPETVTVIVVGQDFVKEGEAVKAVSEDQLLSSEAPENGTRQQ
ncbi:MAG: efflux RND transporter periplasmic adaptor subunit [Alphaproteobacteria bacterium]|nr:efflux RND transporter periplasmic adaptor subunit [Alphaproteobacteria bacterium]